MPRVILSEDDVGILLLLPEDQLRIVLQSLAAGDRCGEMDGGGLFVYERLERKVSSRCTDVKRKRLTKNPEIRRKSGGNPGNPPLPPSPPCPPPFLSPKPPILSPPIIPPKPPTPPLSKRDGAKGEKKPKVQWAEFVSMTNDEHDKLLATHGAADTSRLIEILDNYKGSSGKKYASDYRAILSWVVDELKDRKEKERREGMKSARVAGTVPGRAPQPEHDAFALDSMRRLKEMMGEKGAGA